MLHDFSFTDRLAESGITFVHESTPDGAETFRFSHYDHGNGVLVADVDGDGRYDLYFPSQARSNELWRNLGGGRFENVTERSGLALADRCGVTGAFADVDNDGDPDLYATTVMGGNALFLNDGTGRFEDVSARSGLDHVGHSSTPVFFDYDRDGLLDVLLTNVGVYTSDESAPLETGVAGLEATYRIGVKDAFAGHIKPERAERNLLFRNLGGARFENVSDAVGFDDASWTGDASPVDLNGDGWLDLYLLDMQGHDQYWENQGGKRFVKLSREVFPRTPWGAMGVKFFDWDNDGDLDLYLTDMHSDMAKDIGPELEKEKSAAMEDWPESLLRSGGQSIFGNAFFRNDGNGTFTEISQEIGAENYWPWGLTVADFNADGFQDAFLTSCMNFHFRYSANSLLLNEGGRRFLDAEFVLGVEPRRDGRLAKPWFELDCGGKDAGNPMCQRLGQKGAFVIWDALGTRSSAVFDLDDDGDLDIVTSDFNSEPMVLVSDLAERHPGLRYLKVTLQGTQSNRDGLGARVTVVAGGKAYVQVHDGQSGYLSQSLHPLYFGLADAKSVERVDVLWPSGARQTVPGPLDTNRLLHVVEK